MPWRRLRCVTRERTVATDFDRFLESVGKELGKETVRKIYLFFGRKDQYTNPNLSPRIGQRAR